MTLTKKHTVACLILDIAPKTLKLGIGRRPQKHFQYFLKISSSLVRIKVHPRISLTFLILEMAIKKTLKSWFGRWPQQNIQFCHNISSILGKIKLYTKNQPPSLLNFGYSYEEDLKIRTWKMTSTTFPVFYQYFFLVWLKSSYIPNISILALLILEMTMKKTLKDDLKNISNVF